PQRPLAGLAGSANSYVEGLPRVCQGSGRCRPSGLHAAAEGTRPRSRVTPAARQAEFLHGSERSAAWLAHQSGGLGVASSNLAAPTNKINDLADFSTEHGQGQGSK